MASSRIEMPSSTSPFGCVLRDRNQRESFVSNNNAKSGFRKNITELGDHFFPCINVDESTTQTITATMGLSPRHTRFLDRWATRQAQETASTIERKTHEAEIQALSNSQAVSSKASSFLRETSPALSDTSVLEVDLPNVVGASSLVQMWEARLNRSNTFNLNSTNSSNSTVTVVSGDSRTNSGLSNDDDTNNHVSSSQIDDNQEPPSRGFENAASGEEMEKDETENANESDQRIKVSDIVRKLTSDETNQHHGRANNTTTLEQNNDVRLPRIKARFAAFDQHDFLQVGKSPRIRGRQAFNDLLMQMERDRHHELDSLVERHAVSRFQQRGRIQAMLRLRFLQRGVAIQEQRHQVSNNSLPRGRFNTRVEHGECTVRAEEGSSSTLRLDMAMISSASSQISEAIHQNDQQHVDSTRSSVTYASEVFHEESSSTSDITWQEEASNFAVKNNLETQETENQHIWDDNETVDEQEADDDDYDDNQQIMGSNFDWFRDICRPRDHWEGRRQAWYQEMLESDSNNGEIKQLLERKRVSTCLASDFRQRIDQLMVSRLNQQTQTSDRVEEEEEEDSENEERMGQLMMSFLQRHTHQAGAQEHIEREDNAEEEDEEAEYDEEQEEESSIGNHQYQEAGVYFSQTPSPVQLPLESPISSSWSSYRDQEVCNDSDIQAAPTPLSFAQSPPSQSYYHQEPRVDTSSMNGRRPSLEMELIYDLRGQMVLLHHEMAELKNTIKSCMDMQLQLQHSFKPEDHSGQVEGVEEKSVNRGPKKGNCCICCEAKVDSLLYRCGHMCTCLKCAHELQWSSGKCPICRAPIVDVVRAFPHS